MPFDNLKFLTTLEIYGQVHGLNCGAHMGLPIVVAFIQETFQRTKAPIYNELKVA